MTRIFTFLFSSAISLYAQLPWPSESWGAAQNLTSVMSSSGLTELSGLFWNLETSRLYVVHGDGRIRVLQLNSATNDFSQIGNKSFSGGPEGITQVNLSANEFYTIDENNYEIRKYTHNAGFTTVTLSKHWDLLADPSPMQDTGNSGPEGIAFIPDSFLSDAGFISDETGQAYTSTKGMGGLIFIAHQEQGYIWVFDVNPNVNDDFEFVGKYKTNRGQSNDLSFDQSTGLLYILHNESTNRLEVTDLEIAQIGNERRFVTSQEYLVTIPATDNNNIEGIAMMPKCESSSTGNVWLCRDVESGEDDEIKEDAIRWFNPFAADGNCTPLSVGNVFTNSAKITIFPNPAESEITISGMNFQNASVQITNNLGQVVMKKTNCTGTNFTFDIARLQSGIYVIGIDQLATTSRLKFIKN